MRTSLWSLCLVPFFVAGVVSAQQNAAQKPASQATAFTQPAVAVAKPSAPAGSPACVALRSANQAERAKFAAQKKCRPEDCLSVSSPIFIWRDGALAEVSPFEQAATRCFDIAKGTVGVALRKLAGCPSGDCGADGPKITISSEVVFQSGDKKKTAPLPDGIIVRSASEKLAFVDGAFDYDGDGDPEVLLVESDWEESEKHDIRRTIKTLRSGKLANYPHAPPLHALSRMEDVDHDGRPDLYSPGPYSKLMRPSCGGGADEEPAVDPIFLFHSLGDGKFSAVDAVAQKAVADCSATADISLAKARSKATAKTGTHAVLIKDIVCARMRGQSADDVLKQLAAECQKWDAKLDLDVDGKVMACGQSAAKLTCPAWIKQVAQTNPPLQLAASPKATK